MKPITVAYLGLLENDRATGARAAEEHLTRLAQAVVAASGYGWTVEIVSTGEAPSTQTISAGVVRTLLPTAGKPLVPWHAVSWQLPEVLARADLLHLHDGFSRLGESALLIAKQSNLPVCVTEYGLAGHWLSSELGLMELADVVVCHDPSVARRLTTQRSVEAVPCELNLSKLNMPGMPATTSASLGDFGQSVDDRAVDYRAVGERLYAIYHRLVGLALEVAA